MNKENNFATVLLSVEINTRQTLLTLFAILFVTEVALFMLDYLINWQEASSRESIRKMFSTTEEHSIAGWFAATQTFIVAMTAGAILLLTRASGATLWRQTGWAIITILFAYLSVDDGAAIHEHLGGGLKQTAGIGEVIEEYPSYSWHIVILPFFITLGLFMLIFLWKELRYRSEKLGILVAFTCLALAVGQDFIEGTIEEYDWFEINYGMDSSTILHFAKSLEESLEMLGMSIFLVVFLSHIMHRFRTVTLKFR